MEQTAQYDHIGSKYDEYAQTATLKRAESYTLAQFTDRAMSHTILVVEKRIVDLEEDFVDNALD